MDFEQENSVLEFSCLEVDSGSNVEDGVEAHEVSTAAAGKRKEVPRENMGLKSTRDLAANICMPAGCVTLFVPCPESQKPCQLKREGRGECLAPFQYNPVQSQAA